MANPPISDTTVREILQIPEGMEVAAPLVFSIKRGERRLKQLIGEEAYGELIAEPCELTGDEEDACTLAGALIAAACFYSWRIPAVSQRGVMMQSTVGEAVETWLGGQDVRRNAAGLVNQALEVLEEAGLWQRATTLMMTGVELDES